MFTAKEILDLKQACNDFLNSPRPIDNQSHKREGIFVWCDDWEINELLKRLFNGKETYFAEAPPKRLKFNPLWSKEAIDKQAEDLIDKYKTADEIIKYLKERRNGSA